LPWTAAGFCEAGEQRSSPGAGRGRPACPEAAPRSDRTTPRPGPAWVPGSPRAPVALPLTSETSFFFISLATDCCRQRGGRCGSLVMLGTRRDNAEETSPPRREGCLLNPRCPCRAWGETERRRQEKPLRAPAIRASAQRAAHGSF